MSDRIAVVNAGRIEQVGTAAEVYERPATPFVAGFVGTSNLLRGRAAQAVVGEDGVFSVRPEKIRMDPEGTAPTTSERVAAGTVREVVYVGSVTRFVVDLDVGGELVALQQNARSGSAEVNALRGTRVTLVWSLVDEFRVPDEGEEYDPDSPPEEVPARGPESGDGVAIELQPGG